jgi:hypothetical protein
VEARAALAVQVELGVQARREQQGPAERLGHLVPREQQGRLGPLGRPVRRVRRLPEQREVELGQQRTQMDRETSVLPERQAARVLVRTEPVLERA